MILERISETLLMSAPSPLMNDSLLRRNSVTFHRVSGRDTKVQGDFPIYTQQLGNSLKYTNTCEYQDK